MPKQSPKVAIEAEALRTGLARLRRAVPRGLNNAVLLKLTEQGLAMVAVGDGMWAEVTVPIEDQTQEAQFVVLSPERIAGILAPYKGNVEVSFRSKLRLKGTMSAEVNSSSIAPMFFDAPDFEGDYICLPTDISRTLYAAGKKEANYDVVWMMPGGTVVTDSFHSASLHGWDALKETATVRIEMLARAMQDDAQLAITQGAALIKASNFRARFVTDPRSIPQMERLIAGQEADVKFRATRTELRALAQGQSVLSQGEAFTGNPLWLITRGNRAVIKSIGSQVGEGYAELDAAEVLDTNWIIAVSGIYLVAALSQCVGETVEVGMVGTSVHIGDGTNVEHWMAPMQISGDDGALPDF